MRKKRWLVVSLLIGLLTVGLTTGVVMAQSTQDSGRDSPLGSFVSRVATILGIDETQVQGAFDQANQEIRAERIDQKLAGLVESGQLTQEQADEYRAWLDSRPGGFPPGFRERGFHRGHRFHGGGLFGAPSGAPSQDTAGATVL